LLTAYDDHCFYSFINYAQYSVVYSLSLHDALPILWQARLAIEAFAGPEAREIVQRWREADPESVPALMAAITIHDAHGEREDAAALARQVNELDPNFMPTQTRTLEALLDTDPAAAVAHAESLVEAAANDQDKRDRRRMLGRT